MGRQSENTTAGRLAAAYDAIVSLGDSSAFAADAVRMRTAFQHRTGAFGAEDAWFETRARAFWDDALTRQGFAVLVAEALGAETVEVAQALSRAHRGFFVVEETDERGACLVDLWSGAELLVRYVDATQALTFEHAEGAVDARVTAMPGSAELFALPGAYHHHPDALEPARAVVELAHARGLATHDALDALMRMDLVLRASSRVKPAFAYRAEGLPKG